MSVPTFRVVVLAFLALAACTLAACVESVTQPHRRQLPPAPAPAPPGPSANLMIHTHPRRLSPHRDRTKRTIGRNAAIETDVGGGALATLMCCMCGSDVDATEARLLALLRRRDALLPAFEAILADPESEPIYVRGTFRALVFTHTQGERFIALAVKRLGDADDGVRSGALYYLERYSNPRAAERVIPLLADDKLTVRYAAATTLAKIGRMGRTGSDGCVVESRQASQRRELPDPSQEVPR